MPRDYSRSPPPSSVFSGKFLDGAGQTPYSSRMVAKTMRFRPRASRLDCYNTIAKFREAVLRMDLHEPFEVSGLPVEVVRTHVSSLNQRKDSTARWNVSKTGPDRVSITRTS